MHDHRMPLLLVMNKCDLVPAACVEQWRKWFIARYPGMQVRETGRGRSD